MRNTSIVLFAALVGLAIALGLRAMGGSDGATKRGSDAPTNGTASATSSPDDRTPGDHASHAGTKAAPMAANAATLADLVRAGFADAGNEVCPVMGNPVPDGDPTFLAIDGTVVRFCCAGCDAGFLDDVDGNLRKVRASGGSVDDRLFERTENIVNAANARCPVSGRSLTGKGAVERVIVERGVAVRVCCNTCLPKVHEDPVRYLREAAKSGNVPVDRLR